MATASDVFISYSRADGEFVRRLRAELEARDKAAWVDFEEIPPASRWADELKRAIESSDSFAFVISGSSVRSPECRKELDYAVELNKRIIPLRLRDIDHRDLPEPLSAHSWVPQTGLFEDHFDEALEALNRAIETDLDWVRQHTEWGRKAIEWQESGEDHSFLLSGSELEAAEAWLAEQAGKEPEPTAIHNRFVL